MKTKYVNTDSTDTNSYNNPVIINRIDQAIYESEKEMAEGGVAIELNAALEKLNRKYFKEKIEQ